MQKNKQVQCKAAVYFPSGWELSEEQTASILMVH